ncbi:carbohydrate ABC transporter permease [Paenibacillus montanisoli]|uniref:Carbohydrate ABC transporter permease n=1 Tax=Paenibacillus montanisoli TaxID=2081970 RepID=A0A328U5Z8_9BACL|nr:carbohydrate ABC transporter permease [Paenibacillus montanisoli]RAP77502.1 carbohydrate ABC transporter permease [Paenibacillus montanisoli]
MKKKIDVFTIVNSLFMLGLMFIMLYPFIYMINVSLSSQVYVLKNEVFFWPKGFTTQWYKFVLSDPSLLRGYRNTFIYATLGTVVALVLTSMGAYALSKKHMIFRRQLMLALIFTVLFSGGMIPSYLVIKQLGLLDTIWAIVLPGAVNTFNLLVMRTFFEGIPEEIEDAGRIDGLNDIQLFFRIIVPLSKPVFAAIGLFVAVGLWNDFYKPIIYLKSQELFPLSVVLRDLVIAGSVQSVHTGSNLAAKASGGGGGDVVLESLKYAAIVFATLPILMLYPFLQKYFVKGVMLGSVKG